MHAAIRERIEMAGPWHMVARGSSGRRLSSAQLWLALPAPDLAWFAQPWNEEELKAAVDRLVNAASLSARRGR